MKVAIVGTRGIPNRYGGFERFAEKLATGLAARGFTVTVVNEHGHEAGDAFPGITVVNSAFSKKDNPLKFYYDSLMMTLGTHDAVIVCGVGGAFFYRLRKPGDARIITNVDGLEHKRKKYSLPKRWFVYAAQKVIARRSDAIVADAEAVAAFWRMKFYHQQVHCISYGADDCFPLREPDLGTIGVKKGMYYLIIARIVPENHIAEIIQAFSSSSARRKLVVVGDTDDRYGRKLRLNAPGIIFTGSIYDRQVLDSLRQGAFAYFHGHSVGGTNPSLLEAMNAGCTCICHDNVFNREVTRDTQIYFSSTNDLRSIIMQIENGTLSLQGKGEEAKRIVGEHYSWEKIVDAYCSLLNNLR